MPEATPATTGRPTTTKSVRHHLPTGVLAIAPARDPNQIFAACVDGVYELHADSGEFTKLYAHDSYVSGVVTLPGADTVISAGYDGHLKWFDLGRATVTRDVKAHRFWSWDMALAPDGKKLASVTGQYLAGGEKYEPRSQDEPCVKVFDAETGELVHSLTHVPSVQAVAISRDSRYVAAGNIMGEIRIWDIDSGDMVAQWTTPDFTSWGIIKSHCYIGGVFALEFSLDGEHLLAAGMGPMRDPMAGNGRQLWQKFAFLEDPARKVAETKKGESGEGLMETLAFHPNGNCFLMGGRLRGGKWNAALFDSETGENIHAIDAKCRMTGAFFSADGDRLVMSGCIKQPKPKDGKYAHWGVVEVHAVNSA